MKNIIVFGSNSFIAKKFIENKGDKYNIYPVYRSKQGNSLFLDFAKQDEIKTFCSSIDFKIDGIIFLQGINPSLGIKEINAAHFVKMLTVNLVTPTLLIQSFQDKFSDSACVLFFSSVSKRKGSYDPSYAAAKSGLIGLMHSLANASLNVRYNLISLGLVEGSPVYNTMTQDFRDRHASRMFKRQFVQVENVVSTIDFVLSNYNINRADIEIDGGYV